MNDMEKQWYKEENADFKGWDFSDMKDRWESQPVSWDYANIVGENLTPNKQLLDIGTGGGEFLLSLEHPYENTAATESWAPNIELCKEKLVPLGINFCPTESSDKIGFPSNTFDIIIDRHAEYSVKEITRLLKPEGIFITQQVGSENSKDLANKVNKQSPPVTPFSLETERPKFEKEFLIKQALEEYPTLVFKDVSAVIYFAKRIVWTFPDFSVENNINQLKKLQIEIEQSKKIRTTQHRFLIVGQKKK